MTRGDSIEGSAFFCLHSRKPKHRYRILMPCSSPASFAFARISLTVISVFRTSESDKMSPAVSSIGSDKRSIIANSPESLTLSEMSTGCLKERLSSLTAMRLYSSGMDGVTILSVLLEVFTKFSILLRLPISNSPCFQLSNFFSSALEKPFVFSFSTVFLFSFIAAPSSCGSGHTISP